MVTIPPWKYFWLLRNQFFQDSPANSSDPDCEYVEYAGEWQMRFSSFIFPPFISLDWSVVLQVQYCLVSYVMIFTAGAKNQTYFCKTSFKICWQLFVCIKITLFCLTLWDCVLLFYSNELNWSLSPCLADNMQFQDFFYYVFSYQLYFLVEALTNSWMQFHAVQIGQWP